MPDTAHHDTLSEHNTKLASWLVAKSMPAGPVALAPPAVQVPERLPALAGEDAPARDYRGMLGLVPLAVILAAQAFLSLRLAGDYATGDEARYIYAGHQLIYELWHGGGSPYFETYFSGAPVIYPVLAAMADHLGGLLQVRLMSLSFMLIATVMVFAVTRRLFGYLPAVLAAIIFAGLGTTQSLGALATYDALSLMLMSIAAYCAVRTSDTEKHATRWLLLVPLMLLAANATKYVSVLFDPVVIAMAALQVSSGGWKRVAWRIATLGLATSFVLGLALFSGGGAYLNGVLYTTLNRSGGTSAAFATTRISDHLIAAESFRFIGVAIAGSAVALLPAVLSRSWRRAGYVAVLLLASCLVTLGNLHLHTNESMYKHDDMSAWFGCVATGSLGTVVTWTRSRLAATVISACSVLAALFSAVHFSRVPSALPLTAASRSMIADATMLRPYLSLPRGRYLLGGLTSEQVVYVDQAKIPWFRLYDDLYIKYPVPGRGGDSHGATPGVSCLQPRPDCMYLEGIAGYRAAIRAHWFDVVSLSGGHGTAQDAEIAEAVERTPGYVLLSKAGGAPTWIYARAYRRSTRPAS